MTKYNDKEIVEDIGSHYRLEGDNFWYERVIGPGDDIPLINIGPGMHPDPRIIGPIDGQENLVDRISKLLESSFF